ncbi:MAG: radical SAM protein [bacterium]|nr:radical SAM protein [bacterium]
MQLSYKAPCSKLVNLENIWFQLSKVACNIKCKHCYLDCHQDTRKRNFLPAEKITDAFKLDLPNLRMVYLTGGEPFLHPKINEIIRFCLKKSDVTICTNGTLVNEKKIKVLKTIEAAFLHKICFKFSLDHYMEGRNDEYRGVGVFKKVVNAIKLANRYNIPFSIVCVNLKNEDETLVRKGFSELFQKLGIVYKEEYIKVIPLLKMGTYSKYYNISDKTNTVTYEDLIDFDMEILDCKTSRVISSDGIYSCPALVNDPRGRLGEKLEDSSRNVYLETQTCYDCVNRQDGLFG